MIASFSYCKAGLRAGLGRRRPRHVLGVVAVEALEELVDLHVLVLALLRDVGALLRPELALLAEEDLGVRVALLRDLGGVQGLDAVRHKEGHLRDSTNPVSGYCLDTPRFEESLNN